MGRSRKQFETGTMERVLETVKQYGEAGASRGNVLDRTGFDEKTATQVLKRLTSDGFVNVTGNKRGTRYVFVNNLPVVTTNDPETVTVVNNQ